LQILELKQSPKRHLTKGAKKKQKQKQKREKICQIMATFFPKCQLMSHYGLFSSKCQLCQDNGQFSSKCQLCQIMAIGQTCPPRPTCCHLAGSSQWPEWTTSKASTRQSSSTGCPFFDLSCGWTLTELT
jgi:hypothetical protein